LLVAVICTAVFGTEFAVAIAGVSGLLPFRASPVVGNETPILAPDVADGSDARRSPDPEAMLSPRTAEPLDGPSSAPPARLGPVDNRATSTALTGAKVHRHRASVSHPARSVDGGDRHPREYRNQHALAVEIYQPGGRAPGW
jgi:hypothetical protein